ncbi:MAG TPA: SDR family oxidoreductase [Planctomycetota bacterium]|nr:SDR family oxidoreductase [Planctomycetota bacterium]
MSISFFGRHIVITGASGALGSAVVSSFLEAGATCYLPAREQDSFAHLDSAAADRVKVAKGVDPTNEASVTAFYESLPALWASVHCIGSYSGAPLTETKGADVERLLAANFLSPFYCTREAVRRMRRPPAGGGRIISVAARAGIEPRGGSGMAAYAATKSAIAGLTEALGEELAPEGILVNAVAPSLMDTPANRKAMPKADFSRWPKVEEVAATIVWLASPENLLVRSGVVPVYGRS